MLTQAGLHSLNSGPSEENERRRFGPEDKETFMQREASGNGTWKQGNLWWCEHRTNLMREDEDTRCHLKEGLVYGWFHLKEDLACGW